MDVRTRTSMIVRWEFHLIVAAAKWYFFKIERSDALKDMPLSASEPSSVGRPLRGRPRARNINRSERNGMKVCVSNCARHSFSKIRIISVIAVTFGVGTPPVAVADGTPNFSSAGYGWASRGEAWTPLPGSPAPVGQDPHVRYVPNNTGQQPTYRYADANNANLTQWAKDKLKDNILQDNGFDMFTRASRCWPAGATAFHLDQDNQPISSKPRRKS